MRQLTNNAAKFGPKSFIKSNSSYIVGAKLNSTGETFAYKMIGRIIYQLDELIRPYTSKVLTVISPFLIDEDPTVRLETREIISGLTKAAGLANIISTLRPDLDHVDEYVRNLTARIFAIVANTLGLKSFYHS